MPRKTKTFIQKPPAEIRAEVKQQIAQRDSSIMRWKCLEETIYSEDRRRKEFTDKLTDLKHIPRTIQKFINTLKQSVRLTMRHTGGTPFSIIRQMFLHWDAAKRNALSERDLHRCLMSLGVQTSEQERKDIIKHYSIYNNGGKGVTEDALKSGEDMISYQLLLQDIQRGEPTLLEFTPTNHDYEFQKEQSRRFTTNSDKYTSRPALVKLFIEALRVGIGMQLRVVGGTPYSLLRDAFFISDNNLSGALDEGELVKAMRLLHVNMSSAQAREVIDYYDRKCQGEFNYQVLLEDVCSGIPSLIEHAEMTGADRDSISDTIKNNPFLNDKFRPAPSKVLTAFINNTRTALEQKVAAKGGSIRSWVREAFTSWDPLFTGKITNWQYIQGAAKRLGLAVSEDDAKAIMVSYDRDGRGVMNYQDLIKDILENDPGFMASSKMRSQDENSKMYQSTMRAMVTESHTRIKDPNATLDATGGFGLRPQSAPSVTRKTDLFAPDPAPADSTNKIIFTNTTSSNSSTNKPFTTALQIDPSVTEVLSRVKAAADFFARKSKGSVEPKDVLLGSFLRQDPAGCGRVGAPGAQIVLRLLKIKKYSDDDVVTLVRWYDTNGSNALDYHSLVRDMYGEDVALRRSVPSAPAAHTMVPSLSLSAAGDTSASSTGAAASLPYRPRSENTESCPMLATLKAKPSASTTFDFVTKDRYWSTAYEEEAAIATKALRSGPFRNRPPKAHRPQSATCIPGVGVPQHMGSAAGSTGGKSTVAWSVSPNTTLDSDGIPETFVDCTGKVLSRDSKAYKQLKRALGYRQLVTERSKVVAKLENIERQRKSLQDDYRARHNKAANIAAAESKKAAGAPQNSGPRQDQPPRPSSDNACSSGSRAFVDTTVSGGINAENMGNSLGMTATQYSPVRPSSE